MAHAALLTGSFDKALEFSDRAILLAPDLLVHKGNRAHALMFMGRTEEARRLYVAHKGQRLSELEYKTWEEAVSEDFALFRKAGLGHLAGSAMAEIEQELPVQSR